MTSTKVEDRVTAAVLGAIGHALALTASMTWEILWALILGFALSAVVQAVVRRSTIVTLLGDDRPRTLVIATGLGAASSSCSYAAVALARSLFRKGANFTAAMAFEIGSTNLVVELGIILALLMGWQFTAAEFVGGPIMILVLAVLFRLFVGARLIDAAREQAERGLAGSMEGHAAMDMSIKREGSFWRRLLSPPGFTSIAHVFVMEWLAILRDLILGLLIAGAIAAWVPESFWQSFFLANHPAWSAKMNAMTPPKLMPPFHSTAASGTLPILNIYRKYYGARMMLVLLGTFYASMVVAGYLIELLFGTTNLIPSQRSATVMTAEISWNYTTWLNVIFLVIAAALVVRFITSGGLPMLRMMGGSPDAPHDHHDRHDDHLGH